MGTERYIIATIKSWNIKKAEKLIEDKKDWQIKLITEKKQLNYDNVKKFNPDYIFVPHWSWIIPDQIIDNFECVIFHMTDLPFGRGGSPLQNLIARGVKETKISAIRAAKEVDAGPVYLKKDLLLYGTAQRIFERASNIIFEEMIPYIVEDKPNPSPQKGKVVKFKRRTPEQSDISSLESIKKVYDYIRMLDGEGYPPAHIETQNLRIEFSNAEYSKGYVCAYAKITRKKS